MFGSINYCPETVLIQSAFFLGAKLTNLDEKTDSVLQAVEVIKAAIHEVSRGLALSGEQDFSLRLVEKQAVHCKVHFWLYKTWFKNINIEQCNDDGDDDLDDFPILPKFSTKVYIAIIEQMQWEQLLVECLMHSPPSHLLYQVKNITETILDAPAYEDTTLLTLILDNLLGHDQVNSDNNLLDTMLIKALASLAPLVHNDNMQMTILKKLIEVAFYYIFDVKLISHGNKLQTQTHKLWADSSCQKSLNSIGQIDQLTSQELQQLQENLEIDFSSARLSRACPRPPPEITTNDMDGHISKDESCGELLVILDVLFGLFTQHWTAITHWKQSQDNVVGCFDISIWHPLHRWLLVLYSTLQVAMKKTAKEKLNHFYCELGKYVDNYATCDEKDWVSKALEGSLSEWDCIDRSIDECFDYAEIQLTSMFSCESLEETLSTAVWRVNENLEGCEHCFNWLLTTEELFDNPAWLECIQNNAVRYAGKDQVIMMVDILCIQRQMMESCPERRNSFDEIKKVILDVFKELPTPFQYEIINYSFTMSVNSGLDIQQDSIYFAPCNEDNKTNLQDNLQVVLNKLADVGRVPVLSDIKEMVLVCPYVVLEKVLKEIIKYGHSNNIIYKILQEIPMLCTLCASDLSPKLICQALSSLIDSVNTKQEEKNLINLIQQILKPYKSNPSQVSCQPLLNITELLQTCIVPRLTNHSQYNITIMKLTLALLKASLIILKPNDPKTKTFILKYFIPIVLVLLKYLNACKVLWEDMSPCVSMPVSLGDVIDLRCCVLDVLLVSMDTILHSFKNHSSEITGPVQWLIKKAGQLDWTTSLYLSYLYDILPRNHCWCIPSCVMEVCHLQLENWTGFTIENYDAVCGLFECCAMSELICNEVKNKLQHKSMPVTVAESRLVKSLCKCMATFSPSEISRVVIICRHLLEDLQSDITFPFAMSKSINDKPSLRSTMRMSSVLYQVFQTVSQPLCLSWATPVIVGNMVKHYVNVVKCVSQELSTNEKQWDKDLIEDVFAYDFINICHVICLVPADITDPLFILALDVSARVGQRHRDAMKHYVTMVPTSAYTQSLMQKLST